MTLRFKTVFFLDHTLFIDRYFGYIWTDLIGKKDPIVMFMGHIGVPTKKLVKGNECFIFYFCVLCSAVYANYIVYVPFRYFGVLHAIR
jgi:hypothetical protein